LKKRHSPPFFHSPIQGAGQPGAMGAKEMQRVGNEELEMFCGNGQASWRDAPT
jgi:hypothetical protein